MGMILLFVTAAVLLWAAFAALRPFPQRHLVIATGAPESSYAHFAEQYREILHRDGVELRLLTTHGAVENVRLLSDPHSEVDAGFAQAGTIDPKQFPGLLSLGALFYEPI